MVTCHTYPFLNLLRKESGLKILKLFSYAKENNLPILQHVSLPRIGAFQSILNTLHPNNKVSTDEEENTKRVYINL